MDRSSRCIEDDEERTAVMDDLLQEMIDPAPAPKDTARRRRLWTTAAIVGLAGVGITQLTTSALFTDNATTTDAIQSGTVDLNLATGGGQQLDLAVPPEGIQPGDAYVSPVTVSNDGALSYWYAVDYWATDTDTVTGAGTGTTGDAHLSTQLTLSVFDTADCSVAGTSDASKALSSHTGLVQAEAGFLGSTADPSNARNRTLGSGQSETLCVRLDYPGTGMVDLAADTANTDNAYQGTGTQVTLKFYAAQAAHGATKP